MDSDKRGQGVERAFRGGIGLVFLIGLIASQDFPNGARIFPASVSIAGLALWLTYCLSWLRSGDASGTALDATSESTGGKELIRYGGWIAGYFAIMGLVGFLTATLAFVALFMRLEARSPWSAIALAATIALALAAGLGHMLDITWPRGMLGTADFLSQAWARLWPS